MTVYANFDSNQPAPQKIITCYDTDFATYTLPAAADLLELTPDQVAQWMSKPGGWAVQGGALVAYTPPGPTVATAQAAQSVAMRTACQAAVVAGFSSSALGSAATYASDAASQTNITLAAVHGGSLWCESAGTWAFTAHTAAQAQQVQVDLLAHIQAEQTQYAALLASIAAATTVAAVQAIVWPD